MHRETQVQFESRTGWKEELKQITYNPFRGASLSKLIHVSD